MDVTEVRQYTAQDVIDATLGLMNDPKSNSGGYSEFYLPVLNTVISECKEAENLLRNLKDEVLLEDAPIITSLSDVIPYHAELIRNVLPYGVGMFLFLGDDENTKATFFSTKYDENKSKYVPAAYVSTEAVF